MRSGDGMREKDKEVRSRRGMRDEGERQGGEIRGDEGESQGGEISGWDQGERQ